MWDLNSNQAMQIAQVWLRGNTSAVIEEKNRVISHLSPYFFTARRANQSDSLDKSPKLQLCHDWQLGQNTEGRNITVHLSAFGGGGVLANIGQYLLVVMFYYGH